MEKTRVPKGKRYWYFNLTPFDMADADWRIDRDNFKAGNYFCTKEEADAMAEKIRAVLKGAEMIEMSKAVLVFNDFLAKLKDDGIISYDKGCEYMKEFQSKIVK